METVKTCEAGRIADVPEPEPPPALEIPAELVMSVEGWKLPAGWTLLPGETVEGAIAAFLAMERKRSRVAP